MSRRAPNRPPALSEGQGSREPSPRQLTEFPATDALSDPRHPARLGTQSMGSAAQATVRPQAPRDALRGASPVGARALPTNSRLRLDPKSRARRGDNSNVQEYV